MKIKIIGLLSIIILIFANITAPGLNIAINQDKKNIKMAKAETKYDTNQKITDIINNGEPNLKSVGNIDWLCELSKKNRLNEFFD